MRMGCNTGIERIMLFVMLLGFSGMAFAQAEPKLVPVQPVAPSFPSAANSGVMSAANDAEFVRVARAKAVTKAAEQSGFGKVMSRIFSKRALSVGFRGTPQTLAVGLALEAAMSYFSDDKAGSQDAPTVPLPRNEVWAHRLVDMGLINLSDVEVHAFEENKNIQLIKSGEVDKKNGRFYLKTADGSSVFNRSGGVVNFDSVPSKSALVIVPDKVELFVFKPSPVYQMQNFSCASDVYRGDFSKTGEGYKFFSQDEQGHLFSNDLTALSACVFHSQEKGNSDIVSFSVSGYDGEGLFASGYPVVPRVEIISDYKERYLHPVSHNIEYRLRKRMHQLGNISLTPEFKERIVSYIFSDDALSQQAEKITEPLPLPAMKDIVNNVMMHSASQPDYQGVPFSPSSPVTVEEFQQAAQEVAVPLTKGMLYQQINYYPPLVNAPSGGQHSVFNPAQHSHAPLPGNHLASYPHHSLGAQPALQIDTSHPGIGEPSLDNPPDGKQILAPLLNLLPFIKNLTLPIRAAQCPVAEFEAFEKHYVVDSHCDLLEKNRALFALMAGVVWAFLSLRIILSA